MKGMLHSGTNVPKPAWPVLLALVLGLPPVAGGDSVRRLAVQPPRYQCSLSSSEIALVRSVAGDALRPGGHASRDLTIARTGVDSVWGVTIAREQLVDSLDRWMAGRIASTLASVDAAHTLGDSTRNVVRLARSVQSKLRGARANPVWDATIVSGTLARADSTWMIRTDSGAVSIDVSNMPRVAPELLGRVVIVKGAVRRPDVLDVLRLFELKPNTLELFVMSLCPFGKRAEKEILSRIQRAGWGTAPTLEVRYILYNETPGRGRSYASMHGEREIAEDLVQMVIRDDFPTAYHPYLLLRADSDEPWTALASRAGLDADAIRHIEQRVRSDRMTLMNREYEYAAGTHDIYDRSPSYVWEGRVIRDLRSIPFFADAARDSESCSH